MTAQTEAGTQTRTPLSRERVLQAAVALADREGLESLTMRNLARELGVEAMSLYYHVKNKGDILSGIAETIVAEIAAIPSSGDHWKSILRHKVLSARQVLLRHPWAPRLIEANNEMSPAMFDYYESVVATLRRGGFSVDLTHHALHVMGSRLLGFTQELFDDTEGDEPSPEERAIVSGEWAVQFPYLSEMAMQVTHEGALGGCDDDFEFELALDLILDGLERLREAEGSAPVSSP